MGEMSLRTKIKTILKEERKGIGLIRISGIELSIVSRSFLYKVEKYKIVFF